MFSVGLTGGIASGKSRVLARFAACGLHTLDLDRVSHEVTAPGGSAYADVVAAFGRDVLAPDGAIDRRALGARVFADPVARGRLNAIVHPRVREAEGRWRASLAAVPGAVAVVDAALLVEVGMHLRFDRLVVAHCGEAEQLRRLLARDGLSEQDALARLRAQMPAERKRRFAHLQVDTSGRPVDTDAAADAVAGELRRLASVPRASSPFPEDRARGCLGQAPPAGPRGLDALRAIEALGAAPAIELPALARRLEPPATGPWYDAGRPDEPAGAEPLAAAGVVWAAAVRPSDPDYGAGVAASLAVLTHREGPGVADACVFARLVQTGLAGPQALAALLAEVPGAWLEEATFRGGASVSGRLAPVWRAVRRFPDDLERAKAICAEAGGDPALAGMVVGAALAPPAPAAVEEAVRRLSALRT